ncbi:uncharacterized protein NECHADRAFT_96614 [Fusarium vanettenii 77-13-4]|uniref:FAD-binding domain-containing protein n=1 Tax=Fusarium vanettenii (strain ATCC MYA-4622 / CBS 123669 / FGSC 9596 / NRRL 45880 / 77-13-4) TaxID=660122 RepID=C7ZP18_FUSV7|nr:uncharacterized protein NECHADRAFT_96614 [Fusarium vanettenii 77-13-4]EEU34233.1 hypothetical protein NECHADRAFT_96614 [Fusarium vanettenii 77-13-4]
MAESKLNIIIVGSGLAGLGAATATGGQGICLFSNCVKILQSMGLDADRSGGVPCHDYRLFDKAGKRLKDFPIDFKGRYGVDTLTMKRSYFREELLMLATAPPADGIKGEPVRMVFNTAVAEVNPEAASATLHDGSVVRGDAVIIADGVHSRLRKRITGDETHRAKKNGDTCYRIASSFAKLKEALGYLPEWWDPETADSRISALQTLDDMNRLVAEESWYANGDRKELISTFADFYELIRKILRELTAIALPKRSRFGTFRTWVLSQTDTEDVPSIRLLLPGMDEDDIKSVLSKIDAVRRPRAAKVLQDTRLQADEITREERLANMDYNCGYNGVYEALKELE